jgi:membrane protein
MEMRRRLTQFWRFAAQVARRFDEDRCLELASSLAFTTVLALVPLITVALTLISVFPVSARFVELINAFVSDHMLPQEFAVVISGYVEQFISNAAKLTVLGIAFLAGTAIALMYTIERTFNSIWRVRKERRAGRRLVMYVAILAIGPVLIGLSLSITSYVVSVSLGLSAGVPGASAAILWIAPLLLTVAAFALLYFAVPGTAVEPIHALVGGMVAGVLFELMKRGFAFYVSQVPTYTMVYGAFATVPLFLLWIYLSWVVTALGAVVTALLPDFVGMKRDQPGGAPAALK